MNKDELAEIIKKHEMWLSGLDDGERANLAWADLEGANLAWADLEGADGIYIPLVCPDTGAFN